MPDSTIASRAALLFACTTIVSRVRPPSASKVAVLSVAASSSETPSGRPS